MLRFELLGRGIDPESVDTATDGIDDLATARELARSRARRAAGEPYEKFVAKVGDYLRRKGFDYEVISQVTREAWSEQGGERFPDSADAPA
jgi:SOS response regulatory protein OraA/RecX